MATALYGAFFLSGCSALIFETLWFRQAGLAFGNSIWASSLVLAGFMAGMALGNLIATRRGDTVRRPLRVYAGAEIVVAVTGVLLVLVLPLLGGVLAPLLRPLAGSLPVLNGVRLLLAFILLLVPSTAMGLTLPVLTRTMGAGPARFGAVLGQLYGWNTAGAVAGVLLTEFVFVVTLGVRGTAIGAALLNLAVAAVALQLDRGWRSKGQPEAQAEPAPLPKDWLLAAFGAGFALLALEVIWFRLLLLAAIGYSGTFAVMLATVLLGIALGGLLAGLVLRRWPDAHAYTGPALWAAGALGVGSYGVFLLRLSALSRHLVTDAPEVLALGALLMLPTSIASGAVFTLAGAGLKASGRPDAETTGELTFVNTLGSALGSLAGGFMLLPLLGMEKAVFAVVVLYAASGAVLWAHTAARRNHAITALVVIAASLAAFPFGSLAQRLTRFPVERFAALRDSPGVRAARVEAVREGVAETLLYLKMPILGDVATHALFVNATSMADTDWESRRYMKLYVYWPMAVHPNLKKALLIAYGVGNTAKALADSPDLSSIDVVDISRDVLDSASVIYPKDTENPLRDPRVKIHVEDGRQFLQATDERFDLITSEPPPPRAAGVVNLYTKEYFQLIRSRLAPGGMAAYWLPMHAISGPASRAIIHAFCDAFEDCTLWNAVASQLMLVGTNGAGANGPVTTEHFLRQWQQRPVLRELRALGFERPEQIGALFIGDADYLKRISAHIPPVTDDFPKRIDDRTPAGPTDAALEKDMLDSNACRERFLQSAFIKRTFPPELIEASKRYFDFQGLINAFASRSIEPWDAVHTLLTQSPLKTPVLWLLTSNADLQRGLEAASPEDLGQPVLQVHLGARLLSERSYAAAARSFARAEPGATQKDRAFGLQLYALCMGGEGDRARAMAAERRKDITPTAFWRFVGAACQFEVPAK